MDSIVIGGVSSVSPHVTRGSGILGGAVEKRIS